MDEQIYCKPAKDFTSFAQIGLPNYDKSLKDDSGNDFSFTGFLPYLRKYFFDWLNGNGERDYICYSFGVNDWSTLKKIASALVEHGFLRVGVSLYSFLDQLCPNRDTKSASFGEKFIWWVADGDDKFLRNSLFNFYEKHYETLQFVPNPKKNLSLECKRFLADVLPPDQYRLTMWFINHNHTWYSTSDADGYKVLLPLSQCELSSAEKEIILAAAHNLDKVAYSDFYDFLETIIS